MKPSILRGMGQLARLQGIGIQQFPTTRQAFFNSLAPWLALPLVGGVMLLLGGQVRAAIGNLLFALVALLAPAAVSHALARWWGREARWLRYAIAFNWCQWVITAGGLTALLLGGYLAVDVAVAHVDHVGLRVALRLVREPRREEHRDEQHV